jgi:hypothetical protein
MLRRDVLAALLLVLAVPPPAWADDSCPATEASVAVGSLPRVAAAIRAGRLVVLAIGSGTVLGPHGGMEGSFADFMVRRLRQRLPGVKVELSVQGRRGLTAEAMVPLLRQALATAAPALVLWQTGTVEALRRLPCEPFLRTLRAGAAAVRAAGADLLLVDPQWSRLLQEHAPVALYREVMRMAAVQEGAVLFDRTEVTRAWAASGALDLESAAAAARQRTASLLCACLGRALADGVLRGAGAGRGAT